MKVCVILFTKYVDETKNESIFLNKKMKTKLNFFSHDKLNFQPWT